MTQQSKNSSLVWVGALSVIGYFLYKKYGNPLTAVAQAPNNLLNLQLPATIAQSYFVPTPQVLYYVDPSGVYPTGGIKCGHGFVRVDNRCVPIAVPPTPPSDTPTTPPPSTSGMSLS